MPKSTFITPSFADLTNIYMIRAGMKNKDMQQMLNIAPATWARYKKKPWTIPQGVLRSYKHVLQLSAEEMDKVVEAWR